MIRLSQLDDSQLRKRRKTNLPVHKVAYSLQPFLAGRMAVPVIKTPPFRGYPPSLINLHSTVKATDEAAVGQGLGQVGREC